MQSQDLVSDNASPSNENQGEGVETAPPNDQSTAGNFGAIQGSTPTPVLRTDTNVEQAQSFSSRDAATQVEDRSQTEQQSMMFEAPSVQVSGPNNTRVPMSTNEHEMRPTGQLGEQLTILTSHIQQFGQLIVSFGKILERFEQQVPPNPRNGSQMMPPLASSTSYHTQGTNSDTACSTSVQDSSLNNTKASGLDEEQQLKRTTQGSKRLVSSMFKKLSFGKYLLPQCSSQLSPEPPTNSLSNESTTYKEEAVGLVIVEQPTSATFRSAPVILDPSPPSTSDNSVMSNVETSQPPIDRSFACQRDLSGGGCEYFLCYYDEFSGAYNYERRVSYPSQVPPVIFAPQGRIPHEVAAALGTDEKWYEISQQTLLSLIRDTIKARGPSTGTWSSTGNLGTLQSAEGEFRTEESGTERSRSPRFPHSGNEEITSSKDDAPETEDTSSKHKEETVPLEKKQQCPEGRPLTPPNEVPHDDSQGHVVSHQRDQRSPTDHLPEIIVTVPPLYSVASDLETSRLAAEIPTMPTSSISSQSTDTISSISSILERCVDLPGEQNPDESD